MANFRYLSGVHDDTLLNSGDTLYLGRNAILQNNVGDFALGLANGSSSVDVVINGEVIGTGYGMDFRGINNNRMSDIDVEIGTLGSVIAMNGPGMAIYGSGINLLNNGYISGSGGNSQSIRLSGENVSLVNNGTLAGGVSFERFSDSRNTSGNIENHGTLLGNITGPLGSGDLEIGNTGVIWGENYAIDLFGYGDISIISNGTIHGDIRLVADETVDESQTYFVDLSGGKIHGKVELFGARNIVVGTDYADNFTAASGDDELFGGGGDDVLDGDRGADLLNGGAGIDTALYGGSGVIVSLNRGKGTAGEAAGDVLVSIENLSGTNGGDRLFGDAEDNRLEGNGGDDHISGQEGNDSIFGGDGADTLFGRTGNDLINGGSGRDVMEGGSGEDTFQFDSLDAAPISRDVINDFQAGVDELDLMGLRTSETNPLDFLGSSAFTGSAGEVRFGRNFSKNQTSVQVDVDGDGSADLIIVLKNTTDLLTTDDFVL